MKTKDDLLEVCTDAYDMLCNNLHEYVLDHNGYVDLYDKLVIIEPCQFQGQTLSHLFIDDEGFVRLNWQGGELCVDTQCDIADLAVIIRHINEDNV